MLQMNITKIVEIPVLQRNMKISVAIPVCYKEIWPIHKAGKTVLQMNMTKKLQYLYVTNECDKKKLQFLYVTENYDHKKNKNCDSHLLQTNIKKKLKYLWHRGK